MKLENCGRCGLEPVRRLCVQSVGVHGELSDWQDTFGCPGCAPGQIVGLHGDTWNAAQFAARTERINAAAVALSTKNCFTVDDHLLSEAEMLVEIQDAAARVRWAEMQGE